MASLFRNPMSPSDVLETNIFNILLGYTAVAIIQIMDLVPAVATMLGDLRDVSAILVAFVTCTCLIYNTFFRQRDPKHKD